ncbi:MAG: DUF2860 family protein, partial [Pseudomonadales bacterium]
MAEKRRNKLLAIVLTTLIASAASTAYAATPVAEEPGVSGFFLLGVGAISVESNMLATFRGGNIDLGDDTINSLTSSPDSESAAIPLLDLSVT